MDTEERINADILSLTKSLYEKVGALIVPVEQSAASHVRTLLGEANQVIESVVDSPPAKQAEAIAANASAATDTAAQAPAGAAVGDVVGAGAAPGGGASGELSPATAEALSVLAEAYEESREAIIAEGAQATAAPPLTPLDATAGGSPTGSV